MTLLTEGENDALHQLNNLIQQKRIILYDCEDREYLNVLKEALRRHDLTDVEIWHCIEDMPDDDAIKKKTCRQMEEITQLYRLYDFSDRVLLISRAQQYGTIFNYLQSGLLSGEELAEALLCNF